MPSPCPCGRLDARHKPIEFDQCCGPYLAGTPAPDAEALMRSRYTAFVLGNEGYLLATWHPSTRPAQIDFERHAKWLGLDVRLHRAADAEHAEVEFVARYRVGGAAPGQRGPAGRFDEKIRVVRGGGDRY
jgi:SEC-C motif-containing protein